MRAVFLAVLLLCSALAAHAWNVQDYENFLIGLGEGMEADFAGNISECIDEETTVFDDLDQGFIQLEQGIKDRSPFGIAKGLKQLGQGLELVNNVVQDCGFEEAGQDLAKIVSAFKSGIGGIVEIVIKECIGIFVKRGQVFADIKNASAAWKTGDYKTAGYGIGNLVGILLEDGKK